MERITQPSALATVLDGARSSSAWRRTRSPRRVRVPARRRYGACRFGCRGWGCR